MFIVHHIFTPRWPRRQHGAARARAMASGTPSAKAPDEEAPDEEASDEVEPTSPTIVGGDRQGTRRRRRFAGALGGGSGSSSGGRHSYLRQLRDNLRKPV